MVRIRKYLYVFVDLVVMEVEFFGGYYVLFMFVFVSENFYYEVIYFGKMFCYFFLVVNLKIEYK